MNKHAAIEVPKLSSLAVRATKIIFPNHTSTLIQKTNILFPLSQAIAYNRHNIFTFTLRLSGGQTSEA
jgi:hypothetical protein